MDNNTTFYKEPADLSSFKMTNEEAKLLGQLAREAYDTRNGLDLEGHSRDTWTKVEELITGLENR